MLAKGIGRTIVERLLKTYCTKDLERDLIVSLKEERKRERMISLTY